MEQERGRRISQSAHHISPRPSPHSYHDAVTNLDPTHSQDALSTGQYNSNDTSLDPSSTAQPYDLSFTSDNIDAQYMNSYSVGPVKSNDLQHSLEAGYEPSYLPHTFSTDFGSTFGVNEYASMNSGINPADISKISSPENVSPRLLSPDVPPTSGPQSPVSTNGQFHTPQHSRNTSLDPNSAYGQNEWQSMQVRHQRAPSDVSDVSSVHNSPYLPHVDLVEQHSPLFPATQDPNTYGLDQFSLNEPRSQPGSAYVSPRLLPQQDGLGIHDPINLQYTQLNDMYPSQDFMGHNRHQSVASDIGQADQFAPPTINIEPAPVSRQPSFGPQGEVLGLTPPGSSRGRVRAQSDATFTRPMSSRSVSPGPSGHRNADNLSVEASSPRSISRSPSPAVAEGRISKDRRASTSAINSNNREYILDLADPSRPNGSASNNNNRVQKHPATFQCNLCPKRFTRAYNLRSHLRTHTDERPFVCTVCGKAFARQHDRKRHEGLHSGEKKFVCRGELSHSPGQTWGCGRRFARADALGRHFRSEAGRVCIKPLLDEERAEKQQQMMLHQHHAQQQQAMLQPVPQPLMLDPGTGFALPAALLAQYPALQNIDWSALQNQNVDDTGELSDFGGGVGGGYDDGGIDAGALSDHGAYGHHHGW